MDRPTPTVAELVRRAAEICDPDDVEPAVTATSRCSSRTTTTPITAVENLEERLAIAVEGADYELEDPAVSVAVAVVLYLAAHHGHGHDARDPREVMTLAARAQWHGDPPSDVAGWLASRGAAV